MEDAREQTGRRGLRYGAAHRLRKRADFQKVYKNGRKAHGRFITIFCLRREGSEGEPWRLGLTATRKTGNAVRRNRQRRRVREFFRINQAWIPEGWDYVVNTKAKLNEAKHAELTRDLTGTLARLGFRRTEDAAEGSR